MTAVTLLIHSRAARGARGLAAALLIASTAAGANPATAKTTGPQVQLANGVIQGKTAVISSSAVTLDEFQGIPYAAPPTGPLRWKPPQAVKPWAGVRQTTRFGPRCMQLPLFDDMVFRSDGMSEDCLYLNVWRPANGGKKLPVLVYFYGGGFVGGDGSEKRYDGASLAGKGIITVTVNYRLGVFGFFALPALAAESAQHATGNYGLLDQVAALRWVKANIARFGGDPSQVTIAGESAGSISVSVLMASPLTRGLFARAIGESGALIAPIAPVPLPEIEQHGKALADKLGIDSLAGLRQLPAEKLLQATSETGSAHAEVAIDGYLLTEAPAITFGRGGQAKVPLLLGSNSQEGSYPGLLDKQPPTPANYRAALTKLFGKHAARALSLYPGDSEASVKRSATELASDLFIAHSTWRWMDLQRRTGDAPVYYYYFDQPRPARRHPAPGEVADVGAVHSSEIEYALGNLDGNAVYAWTAADRETSRVMEGYFANFIKTGDPNGKGLPHWTAVSPSGGGWLRQTIDVHTRTQVDKQAARQRFLQDYFANRAPS
ncbi:MAG: carboxylesterase family protein, partial [Pseudomonadota bacterium]|nr:carboxylesterase family protein [Pseudomonadota bacterium]